LAPGDKRGKKKVQVGLFQHLHCPTLAKKERGPFGKRKRETLPKAGKDAGRYINAGEKKGNDRPKRGEEGRKACRLVLAHDRRKRGKNKERIEGKKKEGFSRLVLTIRRGKGKGARGLLTSASEKREKNTYAGEEREGPSISVYV